jgi:hypothetical protein
MAAMAMIQIVEFPPNPPILGLVEAIAGGAFAAAEAAAAGPC